MPRLEGFSRKLMAGLACPLARGGLIRGRELPRHAHCDTSVRISRLISRALRRNRRHNLRKKLRLSRAHIDVEVEVVSKPDSARVAEIWRLFQNTYERATTRFERLTETFWEFVCRQAQSRCIILRERSSGKAVAFMLAIVQGKCVINKFIGLDYGFGSKAYLYFRLWEEFMRFAIEAGAEEVQSGQTGYRAKLDVGHELVPLNNYFRYRNPLIQRSRLSWQGASPGARSTRISPAPCSRAAGGPCARVEAA